MSNNELVEKVSGHLESFQAEFEEIENEFIDFQKEKHFALQLLIKNKFLLSTARNNPQSLKNAIVNLAATGLTLNPVSQLAYLVPRKGEICLDISYKGLIRTATDSGSILWAQSELVYEVDTFSLATVGEKPHHVFSPFKDRGEFLGAYVVVKTFEGDYLTTVMSKDELYYIRDNSEAFKKGYGPWKNFEGEMIKKTVVKRASKMWPRTDKIHLLESAVNTTHDLEGIDFESEREKAENELNNDFPVPVEEREIGEGTYRILYGTENFRNKQLKDIPINLLEDRAIYLEKKQQSQGLDAKYTEIYTSICMYLEKLGGAE